MNMMVSWCMIREIQPWANYEHLRKPAESCYNPSAGIPGVKIKGKADQVDVPNVQKNITKKYMGIRNFFVKILGGYTFDRYPQHIRTRLMSIIEREEQVIRREKNIKKALGK